MIAQSFIKELLDRADIYEVVNRRVPLQQKGASAWACCPFHNEKSPSFSVNRERGFYHCFGCGEHGNAISFLMKYENLPFVDAVEKLASEFSMQVRYEGGAPKPKSGKPRLSEIMQRAMEFYRDKFNSDKFSQDYLHNRGLKDETIERFGIGFSPDAWHNLDAVFTPDLKPLLLEAGLQRTGQSGNVYDFFRNRLMFPIRNIRGQVIAFSARTMIGEEPKYINTGDTPIFAKGSEVFGLYEARKSIQDKKRVIVVEGQMDVIQLSQAGFGEACAPLGTAIRAEHIERLLKMTDHVIFSFDGDAAGRKAAKRAMDLSLPLLDDAQKVSFVFLPEGEDPDSLVKKSGAPAFEEMLKKALPLSSYLIEALSQGLDLAVLEDRNAFIEEASPLVRKTKSPLLRDGLIERLSTAVGYKNSDELRKYFGFPVLPPAAPQRPSGFGNQRYSFGRGYDRYKTPRIPTSTGRSIPPTADAPLMALLRNFLRFPQLALEFEGMLAEQLSESNSPVSELLFKVIERVTHEDESGHTLAQFLADLPGPADENFEKEMDSARSMISTFLLEEGFDSVIRKGLSQGQILQTPLEAARLECRRILLQMELNRVEVQRRALSTKGNLDDADRKVFRDLMQLDQDLQKEIKSIDAGINDILLRKREK